MQFDHNTTPISRSSATHVYRNASSIKNGSSATALASFRAKPGGAGADANADCHNDGGTKSSPRGSPSKEKGGRAVRWIAGLKQLYWAAFGCAVLLAVLAATAPRWSTVVGRPRTETAARKNYNVGQLKDRGRGLANPNPIPKAHQPESAPPPPLEPSAPMLWPEFQPESFVQYDEAAYFDPATLEFRPLALAGAYKPVRIVAGAVASGDHGKVGTEDGRPLGPEALAIAFNPAIVTIPAGPLHATIKTAYPEAHFIAAVRVKGKQSRNRMLGALSGYKVLKPPHQRLNPTTVVLLLGKDLVPVAEIPLRVTPLVVTRLKDNNHKDPPRESTTLSASDVRLQVRGSKVLAVFMSDTSGTVNFAEVEFGAKPLPPPPPPPANGKNLHGEGNARENIERNADTAIDVGGLQVAFVPLQHSHVPATTIETKGRNFALLWPAAEQGDGDGRQNSAAPMLMCWLRKRPLLVPLNGVKGDQYCPFSPSLEVQAEQARNTDRRREQREALHGIQGSTMHNNVEVQLPGEQGLLGVAHTHSPYESQKEKDEVAAVQVSKYGGTYASYFVLMDPKPPYRVRAQSAAFCIPSARHPELCDTIQFVSSIGMLSATELLVGYGINDCEAAVVKLNLRDVLAFTTAAHVVTTAPHSNTTL
eukprot:gene18214-34012_t